MITVTGTAIRPKNVTLRHIVAFDDGTSLVYTDSVQMPEVGQVFEDIEDAMGFMEGNE